MNYMELFKNQYILTAVAVICTTSFFILKRKSNDLRKILFAIYIFTAGFNLLVTPELYFLKVIEVTTCILLIPMLLIALYHNKKYYEGLDISEALKRKVK